MIDEEVIRHYKFYDEHGNCVKEDSMSMKDANWYCIHNCWTAQEIN